MDSTVLVQNALDLVAQGQVVTLPAGEYQISSTLNLHFTKSVASAGLLGYGVRLISNIKNGTPVFKITVDNGGLDIRSFILAGLYVIGNGLEGHGLQVVGSDNSSWFYNFVFRDLDMEFCGGDGLNATGSIFEGSFDNICSRSNKGRGAALGGQPQTGNYGNMTTISWFGGALRKNSVGMEFLNGTNDITMDKVYFVENTSFGLIAPNGLRLLSNSGFENNQRAGIGPAMSLGNWGVLGNVLEGGNGPTQTSLMAGSVIYSNLILDAVNASHGIGPVNNYGAISARGCSPIVANGPGTLKIL